jgi:hypothetical protein
MRPGLGVATAGCSRLGIDGGPAFPLTRALLGTDATHEPPAIQIDALDGFLVGLFQGEIVRTILPGTCATGSRSNPSRGL